jgi:4-amino-4-deoxy-L-arabinose transferase-like glycosyltransferase
MAIFRRLANSSIGRAGLVFVLALAPRLPGLHLFLTSDEPDGVYWAGSQFVAGLISSDLSLTYWHFYPGVTMSWLESIGLTVAWAVARLAGAAPESLAEFVRRPMLDLILAARLPYALLTAAGAAGFYLLARRVWRRRAALLGALLIAFDPFFLAHSRVAHGDAPVAVFMGLSGLAFFVYLSATRANGTGPGYEAAGGAGVPTQGRVEKAWGWLILSAVMGALAALTKAPGQFMAPFVVLVAALDWLGRGWQARRWDRRAAIRWLRDLAVWGAVSACLFVALWPAMWIDPAGTVLRMLDETLGKVSEGHLVFFMGQPTLNPGAWFYPYVIPFRMTPVTLLGALASLGLLAWRLAGRARRGEGYAVVALLWFFVISLLLFGNVSPKKQDRYLLPLFPALDLLAAFAIAEISELANQRIGKSANRQRSDPPQMRVSPSAQLRMGKGMRNRWVGVADYARWHGKKAAGVALALILLVTHAVPMVTAYPYYLAYFNPLMGGLRRAVETTLVGWGEGMEQAAAYLNRRPNAEELYVAAVPAQTLLPYFKGTGENFYTNDVALRADYVVLYISQVQRLAPSQEIVRYFLNMPAEHTVYVENVPYAWIYPGPRLISADVPPGASLTNVGLGDRLRLAGYRMVEPGPASSDLEITLFWHALAPLEADYTVSVRLLAQDGTWLAQQDAWPAGGLLPTSQWRQGDYVQDVHRLGAPAGDAIDRVQVVVYDVTSGQPVGPPVDLPAPGGGAK